MNAEKQRIEPALKPVNEVKIEFLAVEKEAEHLKQGKAMNARLLLPMILATEAIHHGIRELNSPLSE